MTARPRVFFQEEAADPVALAAKYHLPDALRQLVEAVVLVDAAASGASALQPVQAILNQASEVLSTLPVLLATEYSATGTTSTSENLPPIRGPILGRANAAASPLSLEVSEDNSVIGRAVWGPVYDGSFGYVHGGVLTSAFADILACAQQVDAAPAHIGTLTVWYRAACPVGELIEFDGRLDRQEGRRSYFIGTARCHDALVAEAEAIFVAPRPVTD